MQPLSELTGRILDGRYQLLELIGQGNHGVVYRALDHVSRYEVAVKLLRDVEANPEYYVRMVREARAMAALAGTSAVQVHGFGSDVDGVFYIIMELLAGMNFEEHLGRLEARGGHLPPTQLVTILDPIVATLEAAHERGIVHRDLKPSNIFLVDAAGRSAADSGVRLLDFGLVKLMGARPLTRQGMVAGSPSYIAPEAWAGNPSKLDQRIDVYSFAVIIFRCLSGRVPFDTGDLFEKLTLVTTGKRPSLRALRPDLPRDIDYWVEQSMAIKPDDRFLRIRAMWTALRSTLGV
jgi:eukaryotic-like serine/threonine-protein kinase